MSKEINIKSSTIEKGLELAKDFVGRLIGPTVDELGLLISDNVKFLRYKNQIRILLKARNYVEKRNIDTKEIPIKILVPLLEKASLEESEELQDKWAAMIANLCDSETNLQSQIFPYILSQISMEEFEGLQELDKKEKEFSGHKKQYWDFMGQNKNQISLPNEIMTLKQKIELVEQEGFWISLDAYEFSNLERLGLIRELPPNVIIEEFKTENRDVEIYGESEEWHQLEAKYDPDDIGFRITELGEMFLEICKLK